MLTVPRKLQDRFKAYLRQHHVLNPRHAYYLKWLRYYLDFCHKYQYDPTIKQSLPHFIEKLRKKRQNDAQLREAYHAISLYYDLIFKDHIDNKNSSRNVVDSNNKNPAHTPRRIGPRPHGKDNNQQSEKARGRIPAMNSYGGNSVNSPRITPPQREGQFLPTESCTAEPAPIKQVTVASWKSVFEKLAAEIQVRHYSPKTLKTYRMWTAQFQTFTKSKPPEDLSPDDVKGFLTFLAVKRKVSASTQNQAFNSLLFFFRHVLGREFGKVEGVVRAKRKPYIPVVLSRGEIDEILDQLSYPYDLVVKLLYGCGLRLFECLNLRVHCFNFDAGKLTIHDGKGKKDRTVPLPITLMPELRTQMEYLKKIHKQDLARKYSGVFLVNALEKKYKNASKEFIWQWFFPAKQLTYVEKTKEYRRYHLHERHVQKNLKKAAGEARLCKRVTSHIFRYSYASHLLQANYDIRTIQELLGHSDIKTTMIYTHTVQSVTKKEAKSPLDFQD